ncbi:cysteine proteinase [Yamadazyma tenuis ATCC 10573]|uniref:ubiquitinyl hydrolase 1 n=3 Tax=Candida tenuis TaxID=2315449 RepID=G3B7X5_CANTC|nr:cysteine proteinase [Yamadazyma tenuis ATCC 10573]EGV62611.1 cysteine proteinase [Yamadazyma tenuis ATCC 10573]
MKLSGHRKFQHLKWGQQEDAEEFLGYLLDGLHEELVHSIREVNNEQISLLLETVADNETKLQIKNAIKIIKKLNNSSNGGNDNDNSNDDDDNEGWNEIGGGHKKVSSKRTVEIEPSPIKTIFGGQFRSVLQIPNKKDQSITLDPFQCIQLDIKADQINNIEDAFKQLNEPEQIPFKLNDNKEVLAKKQTFIDSLPDVLVIHLKRFSFENVNNGNIEKLRKKIEYTHKLSIPLELFSNWRKSVNRDYKLTGVVYHHGIIAEGGHYTCDVLRPMTVSDSSRWIRIDDTSINNIDEDDVLSNDDDTKNAYLLFYQKL